MSDLYWHRELAACSTLDALRQRWQPLLEAHQMTPQNPEPRYRDAMLSFLGLSALAPRLKLAAMLALGSAFDLDLRLALGALGAAALDDGVDWPDSVAAAVSDHGPAPIVDSADPWLCAFAAGRLAGLRETMRHDGVDWRQAFDDALLELACRHGDAGAAKLALARGADPRAAAWAAVKSAAGGVSLHQETAPQRSDADYGAVLLLLLDAAPARAEALAAALCAAAAAGNTVLLDFLLAQGADLAREGQRALAAAAGQLAWDAFDWLRARGAGSAGVDEAALVAAVSTLDATMIGMALAAGADARAGALAAWRSALETQPWDLYSAETSFTNWRVDALVLLLAAGARPDGAPAADVLGAARDGREVLALLRERSELDAGSRRWVEGLAGRIGAAA